jgi:Delta7-sterol 5-desaturase
LIDHSFGFYGIALLGIILARYFLVAGGMYSFFYFPFNQSSVNATLQHQSPSRSSIQRGIKLSIFSAGVFALAAAGIMSGYNWGITLLYSHSQQYGLWYLGISYIAVLVLQDAYFYFTHRLFHHPSLFPWLHLGHH